LAIKALMVDVDGVLVDGRPGDGPVYMIGRLLPANLPVACRCRIDHSNI